MFTISFNAFNRAIRNRLFQKDDSTRTFRDEDDVSPTESPLGKLVQERQQLSRQYKKLKATYFQIINGYENANVEDSGDKISDLKAAQKIGAKPILVRTGHGKETEELLNKRFPYRPLKKVTLVFDDLADFVKYLDSKD